MFFTELTFTITPCSEEASEMLMAALSEIGFESFAYTDEGFSAYIPSERYSARAVDNLPLLALLGEQYRITRTCTEIENRDWNRIWEESFTPIRIDNRAMIRAGFHAPDPAVEFDIIIDPKMSFGTGHHATTALMLEMMLAHRPAFAGKEVLDMGCGTGILAILAARLGAARVTGIDIDDWAYRNAGENLASNGIRQVEIRIGDASLLTGAERYDVILANINRNILLDDMAAYVSVLREGGMLVMSGFYEHPDLQMIREKALSLGLSAGDFLTRDPWVAAIFNKPKVFC